MKRKWLELPWEDSAYLLNMRGMIFEGNIPQYRSAVVSWWIKTMAEHEKCGKATKQAQA